MARVAYSQVCPKKPAIIFQNNIYKRIFLPILNFDGSQAQTKNEKEKADVFVSKKKKSTSSSSVQNWKQIVGHQFQCQDSLRTTYFTIVKKPKKKKFLNLQFQNHKTN